MLMRKFTSLCDAAPQAPAVVDATGSLNYAALDRRANAVAAQLRAAGLGRGALVAVFMPRTAATLACMLGIMKAGAAYTVVEDEGASEEHCARLLAIGAELTLCEAARAETLRAAGIEAEIAVTVELDEPAGLPALAPDDVAYVLFTSGSTGKPKGVSVTHGNIAHYTDAIASALGVHTPLRYAHVSTLAADLGNTSLLLSLATGGCLHLIDARLRKDPVALRDYLAEHRIEFIKITPTHWNAIASNLDADGLKDVRLRYLVLGGEALTVAFARRILESGAVEVLSNHYGPTEATVGVCAWPMRSLAELDAIKSECVPVGRPLGMTVLRVRDEFGRLHGRDAKGELFIGGPSVAQGYRNEPALTEAAFHALDGEEGRFYRSGDHVSLDGEGVALFLGRVDRQVKVNGYRVELEHVESVLRAIPGVEEGGVFYPQAQGKRRLVAALLVRAGETDLAGVRRALERALPDYMVPKLLLPLDAFPRNANGKVDMKALEAQVIERLAQAAPDAGDEAPAASPLHEEIRAVWRQYLQRGGFGDDESFFDLGGDSLDAIQLIADLQLRGHSVTAHGFLTNPTVNGLVAIRQRTQAAQARAPRAAVDRSRELSPAQSFFLRQGLADPDQHNQAILLRAEHRVDAELMHRAVTRLFVNHPQLRTAYRHDGEGYRTQLMKDEPEDAYEVVFIRKPLDEDARRRRIESVAQGVHQSMSLEHGQLFKARLFKCEGGPDLLLLTAHHIAVDVISWRILVSELSRHYAELAAGHELADAVAATVFQEWVAHVDEHADRLQQHGGAWLERALDLDAAAPALDPDNTEGAALTLWLGYSQAQTQTLLAQLPARTGLPLHIALLAVFAHCHARRHGQAELAIEVESHGRTTFDDSLDISRTVGWHTSTYPVVIAAGAELGDTLSHALAACNVPDLGLAFGVHEKRHAQLEAPAQRSRPAASICYNYLGQIHFGHDERFALTPVGHAIGRGRGDANQRGHALKLSGRVLDERLILDLSFPGKAAAGALSSNELGRIMEDMDRELRLLVDLPVRATGADLLLEPGTRTGLLSYAPKALIDAVESAHRDYRGILFTGATGFVGAHVLRELVLRSDLRVHCLVRGKDGIAPMQRLRDTLEYYFGAEVEQLLDGRVQALEGDVSAEGFGLSPPEYARMLEETDAIYHFAADTRLFGREEDFERQNVFSVRQCIDFARSGKRKDLHYMSTLAVCGLNPCGETIEFSETCGDVGQEFQNHYEATKYRAECLVQEFRAAGGAGFIYRSGNVSGHSRTARFQRNARDNRFVQFLTACIKSGQLPRSYDEPLILSPIDEVAAGIAAISLDGATQGGVFHVDSMQELRVKQVFDALRAIGIEFEQSEHATFSTLFSAQCDRRLGAQRDPELSLGLFWAMRRQRNIRFNNVTTHELMSRLRCSFSQLDDQWVARFVSGLADDGIFAAPRRKFPSPHASAGAGVRPSRMAG